ncbi:MAG: 4Fe-4S dicluster domain-containing protein [Desulfurococcaceae archaeon]
MDYSRCTGCRLCEIACSLKHEGVIWPAASRIRVVEPYPGIAVPSTCVQCPDYPCVKACKVGALRVDENTGAVLVDKAHCTLCGDCVRACPKQAIKIIRGKSYPLVCDLCGGEPACVASCNAAGYGALKLVGRPSDSVVKLYAVAPEEIAEALAARVGLVER